MTATAGQLTAAQHIEQRFHLGEPFDRIVAAGWACDDVHAVLRANGWDLDTSGRLPRSKRITSPSGLRFLPPEAMRADPAPVAPPAVAVVEPPPAPPPPARKRPGPKLRPIPHGSANGYYAHYRRKELPVCGDCQRAYDAERQAKTEARRARTAAELVAAGSRQMAVQCDTWFADAQRSPHRQVRAAAAQAIGALLSLRVAMDALARAERSTRPAGGRG